MPDAHVICYVFSMLQLKLEQRAHESGVRSAASKVNLPFLPVGQCIHFEAPMASGPPTARCLDSGSFNILIDEAFVERAATAREQVLIDSWQCQWHIRRF